jgi:hypothetical protein
MNGSEWWIRMSVEGECPWPKLSHYPAIYLEELTKTTERVSQFNPRPARDANLGAISEIA